MLSCRPHRTILSRSRLTCRTPSSRYYSDKVRGLTAHKILSTLLSYLLPSLNVDALRPFRVVPVYLPTWVIDAEVEATAWLQKAESDDHYIKDRVQVQFAQSDMPGFLYSPLSRLSFMTPSALDPDATPAVPWSESLRRHDGHDVLCLPYSLTPLHLSDAVSSLSMADANISKTLRFEPGSVKQTMIAAYPILIPGYLAQYNIDMPNPATRQNQEMTVSSFIEAHVPNGRSVIEVSPLAKEMFKFLNIPPSDLFINGQHAPLTRSFACVYKVTGRHVNNQLCRPVVEDWVNRALGRETPLQHYRDRFFGTSDSEAIRKVESQWADPRIRPFDADERNANLEWLATGSDVFILNSLLEVYNNKRATPGEPQEVDGSDQETDDAELEWLKKQIVVAEHKREQKTPTWLAEYEIQQRLLETPESSASSNDVAPAQQADNAPQDTASDATTHADSEKPPS
ncbi:hypothetical protein PYCCODRAFT_949919 [Trametes coccinea BRFM310]|uniref:Uncharacterized protein n=1 Tax=Trametes coccinea (strain BRFM310) TaxID=1353009 RepID=A0A1Y2IZV0_TRAC3|nr:hypothetical protein PYCCODRAFT_949919 [Trametes coccinea BRFM310]